MGYIWRGTRKTKYARGSFDVNAIASTVQSTLYDTVRVLYYTSHGVRLPLLLWTPIYQTSFAWPPALHSYTQTTYIAIPNSFYLCQSADATMANTASPKPVADSYRSTTMHISLADISNSDLDILPKLHAILARLDIPSSSIFPAGSPTAATPSQSDLGNGLLRPKDIPSATDGLKQRLHKARLQVSMLPDVSREIWEQEEELEELEERITAQREVLDGLKRRGVEARRTSDTLNGH